MSKQVTLHPTFIAALFDQVGGYRKTTYNEAAIAFIQNGAKLGEKVVDVLPVAIKKHMAHAAELLAKRGQDDGYRTINVVGNLLVQAAVKRLHGQIKAELANDGARVRPMGYTLQGAPDDSLPMIEPDSWALEGTTTEEAATAEELSQKASIDDDHVGREMLDEEQWEAKQLNQHDLRDQVEALAALFVGPCLAADQILNSWRADYGTRPALSYLRVPMVNGEYRDSEDLNDALATLVQMDDERLMQQRTRNRVQVANAAASWS